MDNVKYFQLLHMASAGGQSVCRQFLKRKGFLDELIDKCLEEGYIIEVGHNDSGDPLYRITDKGRAKRDER